MKVSMSHPYSLQKLISGFKCSHIKKLLLRSLKVRRKSKTKSLHVIALFL